MNILTKLSGRFACNKCSMQQNTTLTHCWKLGRQSLQTTYLYRDIILLICSFCSEDIWYFFMRCCLPANGTFNWAPAGANAVLLYDDSYTLITKTVSTRQHCPLCRELKQNKQSISFGSMRKKSGILICDKLHFHRNTFTKLRLKWKNFRIFSTLAVKKHGLQSSRAQQDSCSTTGLYLLFIFCIFPVLNLKTLQSKFLWRIILNT